MITLGAGTVRYDDARLLSCDIIFERAIAITLRDGTTICTGVFLPTGMDKVPSIVTWSPDEKLVGGPRARYAVLHPDSRGVYDSEGDLTFFGCQFVEDGFAFIEWIACQPWSCGKQAISGNSWLAVSQELIASEKTVIATTFSGQNYVEDVARRSINLQVIDEHWRGKGACLDHTTVPGYVMASYTNPIHTHSSFAGFRSVPFPRQVTFQGRTTSTRLSMSKTSRSSLFAI
ncbi:hypothetical protein MGN70_007778 [Eutypa lata]|nr:hypothetical protein MGN70_007778 [Eutypa lata]